MSTRRLILGALLASALVLTPAALAGSDHKTHGGRFALGFNCSSQARQARRARSLSPASCATQLRRRSKNSRSRLSGAAIAGT